MRQLRGALLHAVARIPVTEAGIGDLLMIGFRPGAGHLSIVTRANVRPMRIAHALGRPYDSVVEHGLYAPYLPMQHLRRGLRLIDLAFAAYRFRPISPNF